MSLGMEESSVQWVFSKDPGQLSKIIKIPLIRCLGTEVTTRYGRVDIIYQVNDKDLLVVEVETEIDKVRVKLNQGNITILISAMLETDWEGRWQTRPIYFFLKRMYDKYIYRSETDRFQNEVMGDANMLKGQIEGFLNLQKFRQRL